MCKSNTSDRLRAYWYNYLFMWLCISQNEKLNLPSISSSSNSFSIAVATSRACMRSISVCSWRRCSVLYFACNETDNLILSNLNYHQFYTRTFFKWIAMFLFQRTNTHYLFLFSFHTKYQSMNTLHLINSPDRDLF